MFATVPTTLCERGTMTAAKTDYLTGISYEDYKGQALYGFIAGISCLVFMLVLLAFMNPPVAFGRWLIVPLLGQTVVNGAIWTSTRKSYDHGVLATTCFWQMVSTGVCTVVCGVFFIPHYYAGSAIAFIVSLCMFAPVWWYVNRRWWRA